MRGPVGTLLTNLYTLRECNERLASALRGIRRAVDSAQTDGDPASGLPTKIARLWEDAAVNEAIPESDRVMDDLLDGARHLHDLATDTTEFARAGAGEMVLTDLNAAASAAIRI